MAYLYDVYRHSPPKWLSVEIRRRTELFLWGTDSFDLSSLCQRDVKICAGRAWINIYITPLSKTHFPDSEEFQVLLSSVTKHYIFQERASGQASETYQNL